MTGPAKALPLRTCIACRHERVKEELLRFVVGPDRKVVPDIAFRLPGRGAYTCLDPRCIVIAVQRRQFLRAFKGEAVVDADCDFVGEIAKLIKGRLASMVALANKAGMIVSGSNSIEKVLTPLMAGGIVWIASDASPDRQQKYSFLASRAGCSVHVGCTSVELGGLLGKEQRTFLLLKPSGITVKLRNELERFRKFIDGGAQEP